MYGENRKLMTLRCVVCKRWVALRVDPEDIQRHAAGVLVQHAFADRDGVPYLDASLRELWISGVCGECWPLLCSPNRINYN